MMRAFFQRVVLLPALLLAAACGGGGGAATCTTSNDCQSGQTCVNSICTVTAACDTSNDCQSGQTCINSVCTASSGTVGSACTQRSDCSGNLSCLPSSVGFVDGYCSESCTPNSGCPSGSTCAGLSGTAVEADACLNLCSASSPCRSGYVCCAAFGNSCTPSNYCPANNGGGAGGGSAGSGGGSAGGSGGGSAGGSGGGSAGGSGGGSAGGSGGGSAGGSGGGSAGGSGGGSGTVVPDGGTVGTVGSGGIPSAKTCTPPGTYSPVSGGTVGPSSDPDPSGNDCQEPVGVSSLSTGLREEFGTHAVGDVLTINVPPNTASITIIEQAVAATGDLTYSSGGQSEQIPNFAVATNITLPDGGVIYSDEDQEAGQNLAANESTDPVWDVAPNEVTGTLTIPNTSTMLTSIGTGSLPAGAWKMTVNDFAVECPDFTGCTVPSGATPSIYNVSVLFHAGPTPSTGTVNISVYLVSSTLTAASMLSGGANNASATRYLSTLATIYARAGLCLGKVTFYDVPQWAKTKYASGVNADDTGACDDLDQMFTLSKSGDNSLNFFFVDDIEQGTSNSGGEIVGIDGAIPAPSSVGGTVKSGAVVNASFLTEGTCSGSPNFGTCGADITAYISAHEGGHWMGMYHTTEQLGSIYGQDPVADTLTCDCSAACVGTTQAASCLTATGTPSATDRVVYPANCNGKQHLSTDCDEATSSNCAGNTGPADTSCGGSDNLMFWEVDNYSTGNLSTDQGEIIRANPVVQ